MLNLLSITSARFIDIPLTSYDKLVKFGEGEKDVKKFSFGTNEDRKLNIYRKVAEERGYFYV